MALPSASLAAATLAGSSMPSCSQALSAASRGRATRRRFIVSGIGARCANLSGAAGAAPAMTLRSTIEALTDGNRTRLQEGRRRATLATGPLQLGQAQRALATGHDRPRCDDLARCALARHHLGPPDLDGLAGQRRDTAGEWVEGTQPALDHGRRLRPGYRALGLFDLVGIGHALGRLGRLRQATAGRQLQRLDDEPPAQRGQAVVQRGGAVGRADGLACHQAHGPGVEPGVHLHDGDPGLGVAGLDRAVDGRRAAPARQQGRMDVQAAAPRGVQHPLRQDQAIGGHHHHVGVRRDQRLAGRLGVRGVFAVQLQALRLRHRQARRQRALLDGRGLQLHAAAGRAVGLGQHQGHREAGAQQRVQRDGRELGRTGKNDSHAQARLRTAGCASWPRPLPRESS
mmetsp:Transcript_6682/g.27948  ORF Transcript_6682/g.27948 Transcript_6682/m.27948 type:complete len:400 (+) Transcript_6682:401-1600(+)